MTRRQDEPIPVNPRWLIRSMPEMPCPEGKRHGSRPHGHSGMTAFGLLNRIHGQSADHVHASLFEARGGGDHCQKIPFQVGLTLC